MKSELLLVEQCLNIYDNNRLWYWIPNFNGYELSNDPVPLIRSMKHWRKYPYGILIRPVKGKGKIAAEDPVYELSDKNNERHRIKLSELVYLVKTNTKQVTGYPRTTLQVDISSRNQRCFMEKVITNRFGNQERLSYPKFNIVQNEEDLIPLAELERLPYIVSPIESINNRGEYYGRKNNRPFSYFDV